MADLARWGGVFAAFALAGSALAADPAPMAGMDMAPKAAMMNADPMNMALPMPTMPS